MPHKLIDVSQKPGGYLVISEERDDERAARLSREQLEHASARQRAPENR